MLGGRRATADHHLVPQVAARPPRQHQVSADSRRARPLETRGHAQDHGRLRRLHVQRRESSRPRATQPAAASRLAAQVRALHVPQVGASRHGHVRYQAERRARCRRRHARRVVSTRLAIPLLRVDCRHGERSNTPLFPQTNSNIFFF